MKKIQLKSENDIMSISVDGVSLNVDHRGNHIINKNMISTIQLQDLPLGVPFTVDRDQESHCINFVFHFCKTESEILHLYHSIDLNFESWMENISLPLYAGVIVSNLLRIEDNPINISIEGQLGSAIIKYNVALDVENLDDVICRAEYLIKSMETKMKAILDQVESLVVLESAK